MYNTLPMIRKEKSYISYMKVEDVLRWMNKQWLSIHQYKIGEMSNHFFKCEDVSQKIGERLFKTMECDVIQYWIENK